ncbi:MAG: hypothetical protein Fur0023_07670 [Bacteroidia bacterium]
MPRVFFVGVSVFTFVMIKSQSVQWQRFDANTFNLAKKENKPVLLHLAANWCHWCHVMEEKTYQNKQVVEYLNKHFIVCKEDHDLRPDLANKYRDYGWPATIIFSKDGKELFKNAGYIEAKEFLDILKKVVQNKLTGDEYLVKNTTSTQNTNNIAYIKKDMMNSIDLKAGGFNSAQKSVDWDMFEYAFLHQNNDSLKTWLNKTAENSFGLLDTAWGGIYQYSTYGDWQHPHYEKLLSVQARYIKIYLWYFYVSNEKRYLDAAIKIYEYCKKFLYSPKYRSFYNAQDADLIKGQKATDYFRLSGTERLKKGIPAVDTSINTENNSRMVQSLLDLFAYTKDSIYFYDAQHALQFVLKHRFKNGFYLHATDTLSPPALVDHLQLIKALLKFYFFTQDKLYLNKAEALLNLLQKSFFSGNCFLSYLNTPGYLYPDCLVSENIDAARIFNLSSYVFKNDEYKKISQKVLQYLCSDEVYDKIVVEPGIVTLFEELNADLYTALLLNFSETPSDMEFFVLQIPVNYYLYQRAVTHSIPDDKKDIAESFMDKKEDILLFCTDSFCSAPIYNENDLKSFIFNRILRKN